MTIDQQLRAFSGVQRALLRLSGCTGLTTLPEGLTVGDGATLDLSGCTGLTTLPEGLTVGDGATLYLSGSGIPVAGRDARGYEFRRVVCNNGQVYVNAGCRHFTAEQARAHWPEGSECRALAEMCLS